MKRHIELRSQLVTKIILGCLFSLFFVFIEPSYAQEQDCGTPLEVEVSYRKWCWTWHGPWRCKRTKIATRYLYEFSPHRTRFAFFRKKYEGCCGRDGSPKYKFSKWSFFGSTNSGWDQFSVLRKLSNEPINPDGDCPFFDGESDSPQLLRGSTQSASESTN